MKFPHQLNCVGYDASQNPEQSSKHDIGKCNYKQDSHEKEDNLDNICLISLALNLHKFWDKKAPFLLFEPMFGNVENVAVILSLHGSFAPVSIFYIIAPFAPCAGQVKKNMYREAMLGEEYNEVAVVC